MATKQRLPEGGAIKDDSFITMEEYSRIMKKLLWKEYIRFAKNVVDKISPIQNSKILEIGPGPGWAGIELLSIRPDIELDGLEASPDMVRVARKNAEAEGVGDKTKYRVGTVEKMESIPDSHYDLVISRASLHHWSSPEKAFLQIKRVLKKNGAIYLHDHKRDINLFGKLIVNITGLLVAGKMAKYWKSSIAAAYTKEEIENTLQKIDCSDWKVKTELLNLIIYKNSI